MHMHMHMDSGPPRAMNNSSDCNDYFADPLEPLYCEAPDWVSILQALYLSFIVLGSILGNGLILFLVARYRELRCRSVLVSLTAVITELFIAFVFQLPGVINTSTQGWVFGNAGCQAIGFIGFYLIFVRWMSMAVISMDRFAFIIFPLRYNQWSKPYLVGLTLMAWLLPAVMHMPSIFGIGRYTFRPGLSQCIIDCKDDIICYGVYTAIFGIQMLIGMVIPIILYSILFYISYVKRRKIVMGTQENEEGHRWYQSINLSRQDVRILVSYLLIFVTLVVTNLPVFIMIILRRRFAETYMALPLWAHMLLADLFYLTSILTPLFIMRNRDFKKALKRLVGREKELRRRSIHASFTSLRTMSQVRQPPCETIPCETMNTNQTSQQIKDEINCDSLESDTHVHQTEQVLRADNINTSHDHDFEARV